MTNIKIVDESGDKKYFTIIPNYVLNHSTLWDREVYTQMKRITGEGGTCWASQKTLAKQCGISINRLKKSISYLVEHNWIKQIGKKSISTSGGTQEVNEYRIADLWKKNIDFYENKGIAQEDTPTKGVSREASGGVTTEVKGVSPSDDKEEPNIIRTINNTSNVDVADKELVHLIGLFKGVNPSYRQMFGNKTQRACLTRLLKEHGSEKLGVIIGLLAETNKSQYAPVITTPYELENKLGTWLAFRQKNKPVKKPFFRGMSIVEKNGKKYCVKNGEFLEFAGKEADIEYK